jgi:hypothetical protein
MRVGGRSVPAMCCIAGLAAALTGCGGDSTSSPTGHSSSPPRTSSSGASSSPVAISSPLPASPSLAELARSAATIAYLGMWSDFATAAHASDWQSPLLPQHATAYALQVMQKSLYTDHQNGVITKGAPVDHVSVKSASPASDPTVVVISDCGDSSQTAKYVAKTGQPAPGGAGGRQSITAEVRKQSDGSWKVDQFAVDGVGSC